jgi:hypothetical protein
MLGLAIALAGCSASPQQVTAAPGMTVQRFNAVNSDSDTRLRTDETDWIGINAPVDLTIARNRQSVTFEDRQSGGGVQIMSAPDDYDRAGKPVGAFRVVSISFNIGGGMQKMAEVWPLMERHCRALAQMADVAPAPLPAPEDIAARFRQELAKSKSEFGGLSEEVICRGETKGFTFSLSATHHSGNRAYGGDYDFAFFQGYVSQPIVLDKALLR